jgi:hypothetical protein
LPLFVPVSLPPVLLLLLPVALKALDIFIVLTAVVARVARVVIRGGFVVVGIDRPAHRPSARNPVLPRFSRLHHQVVRRQDVFGPPALVRWLLDAVFGVEDHE